MRVLVIDQECLALDFVLRCADAGHDVRWFRLMKAGKRRRDGEGFGGFTMIDDWRPSMAWAKAGLIFCTGNAKLLPELDVYRGHGFKIFAPTVRSAALEISREAGMKAMADAGIDVPTYKVFDSLKSAAKYARKADQPFVFKAMGDNEDKSLSFVASDPAELVGWIEQRIQRGVVLKGQCMLQEKIDMLCEYGVSGWVGPEGFLPDKWQICIEHKKLLNGELGPNTGEMGTVAQYAETEKLADEMLIPFEPLLKKLGHRGDFAVGVGVDKKGKAWPFEFTARIGCPAWFLQMASHKGDPAQWMRDLLDGKDTLKVSRDVAIGVVMAQPPFPYEDDPGPDVEGNPISGVERLTPDVHLISAMMAKGVEMAGDEVVDATICQTTGSYVLVATALGRTITKAREHVYKVVDDIKFPNAIYRTDIGEKIAPCLDELHEFGFATDLIY